MNNRIEQLLHRKATAWIVLAISLIMTLLAWVTSQYYLDKDATERFNAAVQLARHGIEERMTAYQATLRSGAGLFGSSANVTRAEWRSFVETLRLKTTYPGIQGLGYSVIAPPAGKDALERSVRGEGFPDFAIKPPGERSRYSAIVLLEPFDWRNQRAFGYDMLSEPVRREAMDRAAETGEIAMSGRVTLVQETDQDVQTGTLMYLPLYRKGAPVGTPEERRAALTAFVYSPFRIGDLMNGILGPGDGSLHFDLYDGTDISEGVLMYSSRRKQSTGRADPAMHVAMEQQARFSADVPIEVAGRVWTLRFAGSPKFESDVSSAQPTLIAAGGILADLLLFIVLHSISRTSRLLEREKRRFESAVESAPIAMVMVDEDGWIELVNTTFEKMFGYGRRELIGRKIEVLLPANLHHQHATDRRKYLVSPSLRQMGAGRELYGLRKDGSRIAIEVGLSFLSRESENHVIATVADITERKQQQEALEAERARSESLMHDLAFHDALTGLPNRRLLIDRLNQAVAAARRNRRHGALLFIDLDNFKQINDTLGHEAGDQLLIEVARRLDECTREEDTVARLGGDEFVVMLSGLAETEDDSMDQARLAGEKILTALNRPYQFGDWRQDNTPSIGATLFCNEEDVDDILRRADAAMYEVKSSGRNAMNLQGVPAPGRKE